MSENTYEIKAGAFSLFKVSPETKAKSKNPSSYPDFTGSLKLTYEIIQAIRSGADPEIRIAGWGRVAKTGTIYVQGSVSLDKPSENPVTEQQADQFLTTDAIAAASAPGPIEQAMMEPTEPGRSAKKIVQERNAAAEQPPVDNDLPF